MKFEFGVIRFPSFSPLRGCRGRLKSHPTKRGIVEGELTTPACSAQGEARREPSLSPHCSMLPVCAASKLNQEIAQLDEFLMSDATPVECMDIVTLDGFP